MRDRRPCLLFESNMHHRPNPSRCGAPRAPPPHRLQSQKALQPARAATRAQTSSTDAPTQPPLPARAGSEFIARKRAAGMQRYLSLPLDLRRERPRRPGNFGVRHTKPDDVGTQRSSVTPRRASTNFFRQSPRPRQRCSSRARNHRLDRIPRSPQRYGQRRPQIPRPDNRDARLSAMPGSIAGRTGVRRQASGVGRRPSQTDARRLTPDACFILFAWQNLPLARKLPPNAPSVRLISSRTVYRGPVFSVTTDHVQEPGGVTVRRDLIHHSGSVVVLAVDDSASTPRVLLERQYRHAAGDYLWELPAGRIDPGEQELQGRQARTARGDRIQRRQLEAHPEVLCQSRIRCRNHVGLPGHRPARRRGSA